MEEAKAIITEVQRKTLARQSPSPRETYPLMGTPELDDAIAAALQQARRQVWEEAADLVIRYAVNLGGDGWPKPLIEDGRGNQDAVRTAYAHVMRERANAEGRQ